LLFRLWLLLLDEYLVEVGRKKRDLLIGQEEVIVERLPSG
jgi:hypothetical protein